MTVDIKEFRKAVLIVGKADFNGHEEVNGHMASDHAFAAFSKLLNALHLLEAEHWLNANGKNPDDEVPFSGDDVIELPLDADGHIIPKMPELESGKWYEHRSFKGSPTGPAAFIDPNTKLDWYSRDNGEEVFPSTVSDIDWAQCRKYRKHEALEECVIGFGLF